MYFIHPARIGFAFIVRISFILSKRQQKNYWIQLYSQINPDYFLVDTFIPLDKKCKYLCSHTFWKTVIVEKQTWVKEGTGRKAVTFDL